MQVGRNGFIPPPDCKTFTKWTAWLASDAAEKTARRPSIP
jgi:hypothetical protein